METIHRPGDVANGHILGGDNIWRPAPNPQVLKKQTRRGVVLALGIVAGIVGLLAVAAVLPDPPPEPMSQEERFAIAWDRVGFDTQVQICSLFGSAPGPAADLLADGSDLSRDQARDLLGGECS